MKLQFFDWDTLSDDELGWVNLGTPAQYMANVTSTHGLKTYDVKTSAGAVTGMTVTIGVMWNPSVNYSTTFADSLKTGDIVLFQGDTDSGNLIRTATISKWSHVAFVYRTKTRLEIIEASTNKARLGDCQVHRRLLWLP